MSQAANPPAAYAAEPANPADVPVPPDTGPPARHRSWLRIALVVVGVVLLGAGGTAAVLTYRENGSPSAVVRGYFEALAAGDAGTAIAAGAGPLPVAGHALITADVTRAVAHMAPLSALRVEPALRSGDRATVAVSYHLGGRVDEDVTDHVSVVRTGHGWRLERSVLAVTLTPAAASGWAVVANTTLESAEPSAPVIDTATAGNPSTGASGASTTGASTTGGTTAGTSTTGGTTAGVSTTGGTTSETSTTGGTTAGASTTGGTTAEPTTAEPIGGDVPQAVPGSRQLVFAGAVPVMFESSVLQLEHGSRVVRFDDHADAVSLQVGVSDDAAAAITATVRSAFAACVKGGADVDAFCPQPDPGRAGGVALRSVPQSFTGTTRGDPAALQLAVEPGDSNLIAITGTAAVTGTWSSVDYDNVATDHTGSTSIELHATVPIGAPTQLAWDRG